MLKIFQRKKKDTRKQLKKVLGDFQLPTFPGIAQQVMGQIRDPNASNSGIAELIEKDPGLSTSVLRTVNSATFCLKKRVDNLKQAVAMLGLSQLESLVLSTSVSRLLPRSSTAEHSPRKFWLASARRATVARSIAAEQHPSTIGLCYMAGLLQDMAVPFLIDQKPGEYGRILEQWHSSDDNLAEIEQAEFGWNHAEIATWICNEWELPESLSAAIGGHHGAVVEEFDVPPAVILVSFIREDPEETGINRFLEVAQARYNMDPDRVTELVKKGFEAAEELVGMFASG